MLTVAVTRGGSQIYDIDNCFLARHFVDDGGYNRQMLDLEQL